LGDDVAGLNAFIQEFAHSMLGQHFRLYDQANPRAGLAQLFKTDTEL